MTEVNAGPEGNARRAIEFPEGDALDEQAFKTRLQAAANLNRLSRVMRDWRRPAAD